MLVLLLIYNLRAWFVISEPSHRGAPVTAVVYGLGGPTKTPARTRGSKTNVHMGRPDIHGSHPPSTPAVRELSQNYVFTMIFPAALCGP